MGVPADVQLSSIVHEEIRELRNALKGLICNEKKVIEILGKKAQSQRDGLAEGYKVLFGESLHKRLRSALSGRLQRCVMLWMMAPAERDAALLCEALREGGPQRDRAVIGMLCTRPAGHMYQIKQAYYELFNRTLESHMDGSSPIAMDLQSKSKWAFWRGLSEPKLMEPPKREPAITKLMVALARGSRPVTTTVDRHIALTDAHQLKTVCTGKLGNEETLIRIFCTRSTAQLTATMNYYQQHYSHDIEKALSKKDAGEFLQALRTVVQCIRQPSKFYAEELSAVFPRPGLADEESLIRILTTRAEVDMQLIKMEFLNERKWALDEAIAAGTSGHLRHFLLAIVGHKDAPPSVPRLSTGSSNYASPQVSRHPSDHDSETSATSYFTGSSDQRSF